MKVGKKAIPRTIVLVFLFFGVFFSVQNAAASSITGTVYDNNNNALADVDVELLGNIGSFKNHLRTDTTGRYEFTGLGDGYFTVRVMPFRYDFEEQSQQVYLQTISVVGGGSAFEVLDFYLAPRKGSLIDYEAKVVFAQDIPSEAKKAYEKATDALKKKRLDDGIAGLEVAIAKFPNYYQALLDLGKIYYVKGDFDKAWKLFIRAADINNKSAMSFFFLGDSLRRLNSNKAALVALTQAYTLNGTSVQVLLSLGAVERLEGKSLEAEKHLTQAKKLTRTPIAEIHWELAQLYGNNLKKYSQAADELEAFLKARPDAQDAEKIKKLIKEFREKAADKSQTSK
jgi:tetratricopeptide (TPR) repeat protein